MKRLSIIPEIFIWLAFSVVAGFGYAFSFFEYIGSRAQLTATDIIMPTLVWILLAAICSGGSPENTVLCAFEQKRRAVFRVQRFVIVADRRLGLPFR